jgi:glycerol-3-phosphate dehydrogenase
MGIRPGTDKRDYQIHLHHRANFITVGGIRGTGLTASLGISRHVVQCLLPTIIPPRVDESSPSTLTPRLRSLTPLPNVEELVQQYHKRGDGTVIVDGHVYKVAHPLTRMGWDARTGLAAMKTRTNLGNS